MSSASSSAPSVTDALKLLLAALRQRFGLRFAQALRVVDAAVLPVGLVIVWLGYAQIYHQTPERPHGLFNGDGWWKWYDQMKTLEALRDIKSGAFSPAHQWYPPLYAVLGDVSSWFFHRQPFFLLDLGCLLASFVLFTCIARRLGLPRIVGALLFLATNLGDYNIVNSWVVPWNTDLATPIELAILFASLRLLEGRPAFAAACLLGFAAGIMPAVRPSDLGPLLPTLALVAWRLLGALRTRATGALPAVAGLAASGSLALAITATLHISVWGLHPSGYMEMSKGIGFDPGLIPIHWLSLVVDPRPVFDDSAGMIEDWWWIVPGIAGMLAVLFALARRVAPESGGAPVAHAVVISTIMLHWALYLSYRDIHARGLWLFHNYHYFTWTVAFFALYAVALVVIAARAALHRRRAPALRVLAGAVVALLAICWRGEFARLPPPASAASTNAAARQVTVPAGLPDLSDILLIPASGDDTQIYFSGTDSMEAAGREFHHFSDFRTFPIAGGVMVMPLRHLPAAPSVFTFGPEMQLDSSVAPHVERLRIRFGRPCWLPRRLRPAACGYDAPLPGPVLTRAHQLDFNGRMETSFLEAGGWSDNDDGRWTIGYDSRLRFRLLDRQGLGSGFIAEVEAAAFMPRGAPILDVRVTANGQHVADWHVGSTAPVSLRAAIPAALVGRGGEVTLEISALNARRPVDYQTGSTDRRLLGLRVLALRILPSSAGL